MKVTTFSSPHNQSYNIFSGKKEKKMHTSIYPSISLFQQLNFNLNFALKDERIKGFKGWGWKKDFDYFIFHIEIKDWITSDSIVLSIIFTL